MTAKINSLWGRNRMKVRPILAIIGAVLATAVPISAPTTSNGYRVFFDQIIPSLNGTTPVELSRFEVE
jgi:hypothetical protein